MYTTKQSREIFADGNTKDHVAKGTTVAKAVQLADQVSPSLSRRQRPGSMTQRCVWFDSDDELMAVVGPQEADHADIALAHGLYHRADSTLTLVLPERWASPTLRRLPWISADVRVYTYGEDLQARAIAVPSQAEVVRHTGRPPEKKGHALHLEETPSEWVRELCEWAAQQRDLDAAHLRNMRVWSCVGQRVLTITNPRRPVITAGIDAKSESALQEKLAGPITSDCLTEVKHAVSNGIKNAKDKKFGAFAEHRLQQCLRAAPYRLGLEHPVLREVPAWRPVGGPKPSPAPEASAPPDPWLLGRGFIDLAGLDSLGDMVIVETKLAADDMLVLQGLDYWVWAQAKANRDWLVPRLNADPDRAKTRLLYAVGAKDGSKDGGQPVLSRYCIAHLKALDASVDWRLALLANWETPDMIAAFKPRKEIA